VTPPNLLCVRADASTEMGTGHVMRCVALAQEWQRTDGKVRFMMAPGQAKLEERLASEGFEVAHIDADPGSAADAAQTTQMTQGAAALVIDGYHLGADFRAAIDTEHCATLVVDDCADNGPYESDLLLNQNVGANAELYTQDAALPRMLLGKTYTLLRAEFLGTEREPRTGELPRILVTLGGSDPHDIAGLVLRALEHCESPLGVTLVAGASNPRAQDYRDGCLASRHAIEVVENVGSMAPLMARADVAITAGGSTCWELSYLGVPSLVIIGADNQIPIAEALERAGGARNLGCRTQLTEERIAGELNTLLSDPDLLARMSASQAQLLDGRGSSRVVRALREIQATR